MAFILSFGSIFDYHGKFSLLNSYISLNASSEKFVLDQNNMQLTIIHHVSPW